MICLEFHEFSEFSFGNPIPESLETCTFIPEGNPQTPYQPLTSSLNLKPETFNPQGAKMNFIKMSKYLEPIQSIYPQTGIQNDIQVSNLSQNE